MNILFITVLLLIGCNRETEPINYGKDQCDHCRMTIMDRKFGSEIVTDKGKVLKFDAAECMINYLLENKMNEKETGMYFVTDYTRPETFVNALSAFYLISPKIKSPMGENLSSYSQKEDADNLLKESGGEFYTWETLIEKYKK